MAVINLVNGQDTVDTSKDNVVIVDVFASIRGGRSLDTSGFAPKVIKAGHVIIVDGSGNYKPMPLATNDTVYGALPASHTYAGILIASILTAKPFAGIMVQGTVNPAAAPYSMGTILGAVKTALPLIDFRQD